MMSVLWSTGYCTDYLTAMTLSAISHLAPVHTHLHKLPPAGATRLQRPRWTHVHWLYGYGQLIRMLYTA